MDDELAYQPNINEQWRMLNDNISFDFVVKPLIYYHFYEDIKFLEFGNKILVPKTILYKLSQYDNVKFPLNIKIDNVNYVLGVHEFREDIDYIYIPNRLYLEFNFDTENEVLSKISILHETITPGSSITIKPLKNNITGIPDIEKYLTHNLKTFYSCLHVGDTIKFPHKDDMRFEIVECVPENIISIIDVDLDVVMEPSYEYEEHLKEVEEAEKKSFEEAKQRAIEEAVPAPAPTPYQTSSFTSFSCTGRKLGN